MTLIEHSQSAEFDAASKYWQLEKLYIDLADIKGRSLTPLEKKFLQGLLCGYSPAEIAKQIYQTRSSSSVRVYLSNGLYKYIQALLTSQTGNEVKVQNWSHVIHLLESAGYKQNSWRDRQENNVCLSSCTNSHHPHHNWDEIIEIEPFLGREKELTQLANYAIEERCRLVALLGMAGVGKTALAVKLVEKIQGDFEYVIWRSLRAIPPVEDFCQDLIESLRLETKIPDRVEAKIAWIIEFLRSHRCLLILNQFESILVSGAKVGSYQDNYQAYGEILRRLTTEVHSSCCLLISREQPKEICYSTTENSWVRSLYLDGLQTEEAIELLSLQGLQGSVNEKYFLVNLYANNPSAIAIAALTIKDIFNSKIADFLALETIVLSDLRELLDRQLDRLSEIEKKVVYTLAIDGKLRQWRGIGKEFDLDLSAQEHLEALESLQKRSIVGKNSLNFSQKLLMKTYLLEKFVVEIEAAIENRDLAAIVKHILTEILLKNSKIEVEMS